jgi:hypothetical protein
MKRPNLQIMGVKEREEIQMKGTDNLFHRLIAENFQLRPIGKGEQELEKR